MDFEKGLNLADSLSMSLIGIGVVFFVLISLAMFVLISSKVFSVIAVSTEKADVGKDKKVVNETRTQPVGIKNDKDSKIVAIAIAAIAEETGDSVESFQVVDIKKI